MTREEAKAVIEQLLNLQPGVTERGDELVVWIHDETEGPRLVKRYLSRSNCRDLAAAFERFAGSLGT